MTDKILSDLEILRIARDMISPETWTQGTPARDIDGDEINVFNRNATSFCSLGYLRVAATKSADWIHGYRFQTTNDRGYEIAKQFIPLISESVRYTFTDIATFNDQEGRTVEQVRELFDKLITIKENEGP